MAAPLGLVLVIIIMMQCEKCSVEDLIKNEAINFYTRFNIYPRINNINNNININNLIRFIVGLRSIRYNYKMK